MLISLGIGPYLAPKQAFLVKKGRKRRVFLNVSFSSISKELLVSIKSYMTEELLLNKYLTLSFLFLLLVFYCRTPKCAFCHRCSCTLIHRLKNGINEAQIRGSLSSSSVACQLIKKNDIFGFYLVKNKYPITKRVSLKKFKVHSDSKTHLN